MWLSLSNHKKNFPHHKLLCCCCHHHPCVDFSESPLLCPDPLSLSLFISLSFNSVDKKTKRERERRTEPDEDNKEETRYRTRGKPNNRRNNFGNYRSPLCTIFAVFKFPM
mmetsp:Transcript_9231/g.10041  ORF Transcript_9231/g.10041 Transcript_9231/m.10041 type:complete len:110 (-) Transcript_9231:190-519(-)